jgi:hypothetical protein
VKPQQELDIQEFVIVFWCMNHSPQGGDLAAHGARPATDVAFQSHVPVMSVVELFMKQNLSAASKHETRSIH